MGKRHSRSVTYEQRTALKELSILVILFYRKLKILYEIIQLTLRFLRFRINVHIPTSLHICVIFFDIHLFLRVCLFSTELQGANCPADFIWKLRILVTQGGDGEGKAEKNRAGEAGEHLLSS